MIKKYWKIIVVVIVLILAGLYIGVNFSLKSLLWTP